MFKSTESALKKTMACAGLLWTTRRKPLYTRTRCGVTGLLFRSHAIRNNSPAASNAESNYSLQLAGGSAVPDSTWIFSDTVSRITVTTSCNK